MPHSYSSLGLALVLERCFWLYCFCCSVVGGGGGGSGGGGGGGGGEDGDNDGVKSIVIKRLQVTTST